MKDTYWNNKGKHQEAYQKLANELLPYSGKADTLHGELLRALGKLYYDYYNNGMCNNTSGPALFITGYFDQINACDKIRSALRDIYLESNTGGYTNMELDEPLEMLADYIIEHVMSTENQPNSEDMYDHQEDDHYEDEDEYDDED